MSRIDKALDVIDVGLQHAGDVAYTLDNGQCVRCQTRPPGEGSSWCEQCQPGRTPTAAEIQAAIVAWPVLRDGFEALANFVVDAMATLASVGPELLAAANAPRVPYQPCHCFCEVSHP